MLIQPEKRCSLGFRLELCSGHSTSSTLTLANNVFMELHRHVEIGLGAVIYSKDKILMLQNVKTSLTVCGIAYGCDR